MIINGYEKIPGYCGKKEFKILCNLIDKLSSPKIAIETGTLCGRKTYILASLCDQIHTYDVFESLSYTDAIKHYNSLSDKFEQPKINLNHKLVDVKRTLSDFDNINYVKIEENQWFCMNDFLSKKANFFYIDDNHSFEYVNHRLWTMVPSAYINNGIICGDDYDLNSVKEAVNSFSSIFDLEISITERHWYISFLNPKNKLSFATPFRNLEPYHNLYLHPKNFSKEFNDKYCYETDNLFFSLLHNSYRHF